MLITVCLSAIEKHGLECFVHLEGPSPWLAALWRLMGWSGSEGLVMPGQSSPRVVLLQGAWPLSRKGGRAGTTGGHRLLHCFTAHTQTDFGLYHRMGFSAFLWEVQKAEIMSVLLFTSTALPLCLTLTSANNRVTPSGLVEDSGYCANVRVQNNLNSVHLLPFLELTTTAHGCCWVFFPHKIFIAWNLGSSHKNFVSNHARHSYFPSCAFTSSLFGIPHTHPLLLV